MNSKYSNLYRLVVVIILALVIGTVIWAKNSNKTTNQAVNQTASQTMIVKTESSDNSPNEKGSKNINTGKARLVDLGSNSCAACIAMIPVLEELKTKYPEDLTVEFIDVWENEPAATFYKINAIPTQIFFDKNGKELYRHLGAISTQEIIKKFEEFGVSITK